MFNSIPYRFIYNLPRIAAYWLKFVISISIVSFVWSGRTKLGYRTIVIDLFAIYLSYSYTLLDLIKDIDFIPSNLQILVIKLRLIKAYSIVLVSIRNLIE